MDKRTRDRRSASSSIGAQPYTPIQRSVQIVDPIAARALQENIDQQNNPNRRYVGNTGKRNAHIDTYTNRTAGVSTQILDTPNQGRGRTRDVAFNDMRQTSDFGQRADKGTAFDRQLRSNVVKDQISRGLGEQRSGDRITANPTTPSRARLYERIGGAAFASTPDQAGDQVVSGRVTRDGGVLNARGQKVAMPNIKGLRAGLSQMAVRNMMAQVGGAPVQALMQVDSILKGKFGIGLFENAQNQRIKAAQEIEGWGPGLGLFK